MVDEAGEIAHAAAEAFGPDAVRPGTPADGLDGVAPRVVFEPANARAAAEMLAWADARRLTVVPRGGGTKLTWGADASSAGAILSLTRLNAVVQHSAGDLVATVEAGASLEAANESLKREHQWIPLDPAFSGRATIGGIVAANDSGPRRHRFGAPRDQILGVEMALANGRIAKAGGRVVKNVAGYDLARLLCGSFGSLAVILSATFKLAPLAQASRTVVVDVARARPLADLALAIASSQLDPSAVELEWPALRLMLRFETAERAADQQAAAAVELGTREGGRAMLLEGEAESGLWRAYADRLNSPSGALVKLAVLPADVGDVLDRVERLMMAHGVQCHIAGRAALGVLFLRIDGDTDGQAAALVDLHAQLEATRGRAVLLRGLPDLKSLLGPWGRAGAGDALPVLRSVKGQFDPHGTLGPGRSLMSL